MAIYACKDCEHEEYVPRGYRFQPPRSAEFLLHALLPGEIQDTLARDLQEQFHTQAERIGIGGARRWYYRQTLTSLWPSFVGFVRRGGRRTLKARKRN
jgi:hypothetical protein